MAMLPETGSASGSPWYISRRYALLWLGNLLSSTGDMLFEFALIIWVATRYGADGGWLVAAISVASLLPLILVGPLAGTLVDQARDKVRIAVRSGLLVAGLTVVVIPLVHGDGSGDGSWLPAATQTVVLLTLVAVISGVNQFIQPAESVLSRDIVAVVDRPRASALGQVAQGFSILVGPAAAGPLVVVFGVEWALALNAASFVVAALLVRVAAAGIPQPEPRAGVSGVAGTGVRIRLRRVAADLAEGVRLLTGSPTLRMIVLCMMIAVGGFGLINAIDVFFVVENLGGSEDDYGFFVAAQGVGSLIGAAATSVLVGRVTMPVLFCGSLVAIGAVTLVYAQLTSVPVGLGIIVVLGLAIPAINIALSPILLAVTPRSHLGRVGGLLNPLINGATIVGVSIGGLIFQVLGPGFSMSVLGVPFGALDGLITLSGLFALAAAWFAWIRFRSAAVRAELEAAPGSVPDPDLPGVMDDEPG